MPAIQPTGDSSLAAISSAYHTTGEEEKDPLGRDAFLTMLVAQLQNQDPLNPKEGTDFTSQLAQYSQLEQTISSNDNLESIKNAILEQSSETNTSDYLGKEVIGEVDAIEVTDGEPFGGFYTLEDPANVMILVTDANGAEVRTLYPGQMEAGNNDIDWDGMDNEGNPVMDGTYNYTVLSDNGSGFTKVLTTVSGKVDAILNKDGKTYLQVAGTFIQAESVLKVMEPVENTSAITNPLEYLGREIRVAETLINVDGGEVGGSGVSFSIERPDDVQVVIFDRNGNEIRTIELSKDEVEAGENTVSWDGKDNQGDMVANDLYGYVIKTKGVPVDMTRTGIVDGVSYKNGVAYLHLEDGSLADPISILNIK
ncbi:MAG: hypothetical protein B6I31_02595 [Desulfobacteraceae bacterium 4572_19]|nr:MAG: hypothetical protein B6I31_02595 [Desulfobacteraceae bacterium 4572_19]